MASDPGQGVRDGIVLGSCVTGNVVEQSIDNTSVSIGIVGSRDDASASLGVSAGLGIRTLAGKGNVRASFANSSVETETTFSLNVRVEHRAFQRAIDPINGLKRVVDRSSPRFNAICGDTGIVGSVIYGGRLVLAVHFHFRSATRKAEFRAAMSASLGRGGQGVNVSSEIEKLAEVFSSDVTLGVEAFQDGGNSESLGGVFLGTGDATAAADNQSRCSQGQLTACIQLVSSALTYFNTPNVVAAFKANPAAIGWDVLPWSALNLPDSIDVPTEVFLARRSLEQRWDDLLAAKVMIAVNRGFGIESPELAQQVAINEGVLEVASDQCMNKLDVADQRGISGCLSAASDEGLRALGWKPLSEVVVPMTAEPNPMLSWCGFGTLGDAGTNSGTFNNSLTGEPSCPGGCQMVSFARILDPEQRSGATLFGCMADFAPTLTAQTVHSFQEITFDDRPVFCREGSPVLIARAIHPELQIGESLYACVSNTDVTTPSQLLGMFTEDGCATDNVPNPVTHTGACPPGSRMEAVWRLQAPESHCGEVLFACWWTPP